MRNEIMTLTELTKNGVKVARLAGNRDLNEKAVSAQHNAPPPNRRVPIQPAYSAEHGKQNSTNKSNS